MILTAILTIALAAPVLSVVRFHCSQLVVQRLDPLVEPGQIPSSHVHQIVGGVRKRVRFSIMLLVV
jgi:hypothetical protein